MSGKFIKKIVPGLIMAFALMIGGCAKDAGSPAVDTGAASAKETEAVSLSGGLYLIKDGTAKLDLASLITLDTDGVEATLGQIVKGSMDDAVAESFPPQGIMENAKVQEGKATGLKISFELAEAIMEVNGEGTVLVDVRTEAERSSGYIPDSKLFPSETIADTFKDSYGTDRIVIVYCRSGKRSAAVQETLEKQGYFVLDAGGIPDYKKELVFDN